METSRRTQLAVRTRTANRKLPASPKPRTPQRKSESRTVVWGHDLESANFLIVPKTLFYLGRYSDQVGKDIQPRHILLILALAARKFQSKPIRAYWADLAGCLGVTVNTVRKWGYQLRDQRLLIITQNRGRDPERNQPGVRNESNTFDIEPFVEFVRQAYEVWMQNRPTNGSDAS